MIFDIRSCFAKMLGNEGEQFGVGLFWGFIVWISTTVRKTQS